MGKEKKVCMILGVSGQVGSWCSIFFREAGWQVTGTYFSTPVNAGIKVDIADYKLIEPFIDEHRPDAIIMAAAQADVDASEVDKEAAMLINADAPAHWAYVSAAKKIPFVYISTDYVFHENDSPATEEIPPNPMNYYAETKLEGEKKVFDAHPGALVARTSVVYSYLKNSRNFFMQLYNKLSNNQAYPAFIDQYATPTYCPDIAKALFLAIEKNVTGILHVAGPEYLSRYEFALEAAEIFSWNKDLIIPSRTGDVKLKAVRPKSAGLKINKLVNILGDNIMRPPRQALRDILSTK